MSLVSWLFHMKHFPFCGQKQTLLSYYWKFSTDVTATQFFRKIYIWKINTSQNNYRQPSDCGMVTGWSQFKPSPYSVGHSHTNFTIFNVNGKAKGLARIGKGRLHNCALTCINSLMWKLCVETKFYICFHRYTCGLCGCDIVF